MLNKKEILNEIKRLMKFQTEEEKTEVMENYVDAKSGENIVRVEGEDFVVGADIFVVTEDGLLPAPDGEHILEDGRKLTVGGGKITEIELPEIDDVVEEIVELAEEEKPEEEMEEITPEEKAQEKESAMKKMEDAEKKIEEMEKKITDMEDVIKEMVKAYGKVGSFSKSVEDKLDEFIKNTPAEQHFSSLKSEYKTLLKERKTTENSSLDRIKELRSKK
jgi:hypothetical protein